jgi:hypothetical protein
MSFLTSNVTGIDYVPTLLERACERAAAERLPVTFNEGDATMMVPSEYLEIVATRLPNVNPEGPWRPPRSLRSPPPLNRLPPPTSLGSYPVVAFRHG